MGTATGMGSVVAGVGASGEALDPQRVGDAVRALLVCGEACAGWAGARLAGSPRGGDVVRLVRACVECAELCVAAVRALGDPVDSPGLRELLRRCVWVCTEHSGTHRDWDCAEAGWTAARACLEVLPRP
jgi:hypothetical protein